MKASESVKKLIKSFEGCLLVAYDDGVGVWTIGYGHTRGVYCGMVISQAQAEAYFEEDIVIYENCVNAYLSTYNFNQNQFDALVSFTFNLGTDSIDTLTANGTRSISTISDKILEYNKAGGVVWEGLVRRRVAEKELFDTPCDSNSGWQQGEKGGWRYIVNKSPLRNCWKQIGDQWYYFWANGYMASDEFIKSSDYDTSKKLYYVNKDGSWDNKEYRWEKDNCGWWLVEIDGLWYPKKQWEKVDQKWYYFSDKGYMVANKTITIKGKKYTFNKDGELIS